jgi:hypothetical protein
MPQFHETIYGKRFLDRQLPMLIEKLDMIANELKRSNDLKEHDYQVSRLDLKRLADDVAEYDYRLAQILDEVVKR